MDRRKLPAPNFSASQEAAAPAGAVLTDLGRDIFEVIRAVLGHEQFGASTNLLHAGLASLSAIKLCTLLKKRFGAAPGERRGDAHAALAQEGLRLVAIGQETGVGEVTVILVRQPGAQGAQHGEATETGIEDGNGAVIHVVAAA